MEETELSGPQLISQRSLPVDRYSKNSKKEEKRGPAYIKDRGHIFLILKVKETFPLHSRRKVPGRSEREGHHPTVGDINLLIVLFAESILAEMCAHT